MLVDLGRGTSARASEILAIHPGGHLPPDVDGLFLVRQSGRGAPKSWLLLKGGHLVPSYLSADEARAAWESALHAEMALRVKARQAVKFGGELHA